MLYVLLGVCFFAVIIGLNFKDTITEVLKNRSTAAQASPAAIPAATASKKAAEYQWYVSYPAIAAAVGVVLLVITYSFPYWRAGYDIAGGPPWWLLILVVVAIGAVAMTTRGMMRTATLTLSLSVLLLVLSVYLVRGFANMPDCLDDVTCYEVAEEVHYPAPPPAPAPVITRRSCYEGTIRYTSADFTKGKVETLNEDECSFAPRVKIGLVQFLDHADRPIGTPWDPDTERDGTTIPVKAKCLADVCEVKYSLCPNDQQQAPGSWDCQWKSGGGTTNTYGVAAGVDMRLGVFHSTD